LRLRSSVKPKGASPWAPGDRPSERSQMTSFDPRVDRGAAAAIQRDQPEVPAAAPTSDEQAAADRVLAHYVDFRRDQLLPLLHEVHAETGWFSEELTRYLSQRLNVPFANLYGVISFYALFKTRPTGRTVLRICNGIPCYLHGAYDVGLRVQELLGVGPEEPTPDKRLSWEWFACLGQCDHAPAMLVGEEAVGNVTPETLEWIVQQNRGDGD
jgi:NADH:ubiquinone oxidoreductase subunit E